MQKKLRTLLILSFLSLFGAGCALQELQQDNVNRAARIDNKRQGLSNIETQNQHLTDEKNNLASELDKKNITLDELNAQLSRLKAENAKIKVDTKAKRKKQAELSRSLDQYSAKINVLDKDKSLSIEEKNKKIEELRLQIKDKVKRDSKLFAN